MAISYVASAEGTSADAGGVVVIPPETADGDRLIVVMESNSVAGYTHITPPEWTAPETFTGASGQPGGSQITTLFTKIADDNDAGSTVTFEVTPVGSTKAVAVAVYRGSVTTPQWLASGLLPTATSGTTLAVPVLDVAALPTTLVTAATRKGGTALPVFTPPAGFTARVTDSVTGNGCAIADGAATATGPTSVSPWSTDTSSGAGVGILVALAEGPAPVQEAPTFRRFTSSGWFPPIT